MGKASRIVGSTLVGIVLGIFACSQLLSGYLAQWYQIPLPDKINRIITVQSQSLWVQVENGNVYRCDGVHCLLIRLAPEAVSNPNEYESITPCYYEPSTLSPSTHPPASIIFCQESITFFVSVAYAQDKNGQLWYWNEYSLNGELFLLGWCSIPIGAIVGFTIGLIWSRQKQKTLQPVSSASQQSTTTDSSSQRRRKVRKVIR